MIRHLTIPLLLLCAVVPAMAQYHSVNYDTRTVAAMSTAFATEAATEVYYAQQTARIREHYQAAEVAAAGIFSSKYLDRKALTDLGLWTSATENYYYRRIYNMVSAKIMPKIWTVAGMMLKSPHNALYWGSYMYKICDEVKTLCYQFESIVTNSTLSFRDIAFLEINRELAAVLKLSEIGDVDWATLLDSFTDIGANLTMENLRQDIDNLYAMGAGLASAGVGNAVGSILGSSSFNGNILEKAGSVIEIAGNVYDMYGDLSRNAGNTLLRFVGGEEGIANLFSLSNYSTTAWITDYANEAYGQYYTQKWYICRSDATNDVVYEDVFDSYTMDLSTFKADMNARLSELNDNDEGYTYYLSSDAKRYYQTTDAQKIAGCETATISVTCHDGATLGEGSTQYKCSECGSSVNSHTRECAMATSVSQEEAINTSEIDVGIEELQGKIASLQTEVSVLEVENSELLEKIRTSSVEDAARYRQEYNANNDRISGLKSEKESLEDELAGYQDARQEAIDGENTVTDDYYRIPALMNDCETSYNLTWNGSGAWSGNSFVRTASMPDINGTITFRATVSIARKPKYFLGIKIHRAIVQISWSLTTDYSDTQVVAVVNLDPSKTDAEKADEVNARLSEVAREFPGCTPSVEYARNDPLQADDTGDTYHLLWSSDRLDIARQIDTRLTNIYADLVSLEKMMHYKHSIIDMLKSVTPYINDESGRRRSLIEQCRERWLRQAVTTAHSDTYNGRYDEDED